LEGRGSAPKEEKIGRKAAAFVQNGARLFLDAGSTTDEIVRVLCKKIENRALNKLTVGTTSVSIADKISTCCVKMGFDDDFSAVRLFVPGGQIRPSTQAIVSAFESNPRHIFCLSEAVGGFDIGIVGVNGVSEEGFTTHENSEAQNKIDIMNVARERLIVGDSSKVGLTLDRKFADFNDNLRFIVDDDRENARLQSLVASYAQKIILV
jgi:DeoR family transcriptional regulator, fructose operon transcriptional repressor